MILKCSNKLLLVLDQPVRWLEKHLKTKSLFCGKRRDEREVATTLSPDFSREDE
jgi:hypothetical protein